jgi:hypothetical protein
VAGIFERVVAVDRDHRSGVAGDGDDPALVIGEERASVGAVRAFVPEQGIVGSRAVDVAADDRARPRELRDEIVAVVEELGGSRRNARDWNRRPSGS